MVPDPDGDPEIVEYLPDIVRVEAVDDEGDRAPAI
jgi:hypothetical protein